MNELLIEPESLEGGGVRLRLGGVLDKSGAELLCSKINEVSHPVAVDFSRLQRLSDFGLGILAMNLAEMPNEVQFVGLGHHAQRILRAFGFANAA
jgi:hypothetical protein